MQSLLRVSLSGFLLIITTTTTIIIIIIVIIIIITSHENDYTPSWLVHLKLSRRMQRPGMGGWVCLAFLELHNCQLSLLLLISCGKCCVSKLRKASMSWLRTPRKYQRTEEDHAIIITVTTTMTTAITKTIYCTNGNRIEWSPIHAVCNHRSGH